jgi:hypothetical protein
MSREYKKSIVRKNPPREALVISEKQGVSRFATVVAIAHSKFKIAFPLRPANFVSKFLTFIIFNFQFVSCTIGRCCNILQHANFSMLR